MKTKELKEFITSLKSTDIEELKVESGGSEIYFKKPDVISVPRPEQANSAQKQKLQEKEKRTVPVKSPMVGTFYHSESKDRPPYVMAGNHVVPGQKIGLIEAMKIIKDVNSNVKGRIIKSLVKNGHPVEYGQELFLVELDG